jgi:ABC-type amino acid transport substrate-binding protein
MVPQLSNTTEVLKFVAEDKADFTFVEPFLAEYFNKTSSVKLVRASEVPIRIYENTFIFKKGEKRLKDFFDKELDLLKETGRIKQLIKKYTGSSDTFIVE